MVKVFQQTETEYYLDGYLKNNLDLAKEMVTNDNDIAICVDGTEGCGKSVCAMQIGFYLDPTLCIERICFNDKDFIEKVIKAEKFQCVIFDEAYGSLASRQALSLVNRAMIKVLAEIRQKNLFIIIVLPTFFELDRYAAIWRSKFLLHCYTNKGQRGFFSFYSADNKKLLYLMGKKLYNYNAVGADFRGRFTKHYVLDETIYRQKKLDALAMHNTVKELPPKPMGKRELRQQEVNTYLVNFMHSIGYNNVDIENICTYPEQHISRIVRKFKNAKPPHIT